MNKKIIVILFGILALGVGIYLMVSGSGMAKKCIVEAVGTVIDVIEERQENTETDVSGVDIYDSYTYVYYPVIEYTVGDNTVSGKYSNGISKRKYNTGDKVDILYNPEKTDEYLIKNDKTTNFLGIAFIVAGIVVTIIGVVKKEF